MASDDQRPDIRRSAATPTKTPPRDPLDEAWFPPPREGVRRPPPGVVYQASAPPRSPTDPYSELRRMSNGDDLWPLEDPGIPVAPPPRSGFTPFVVGLALGLTLAVVSIVGFQMFRRDAPEEAATTPVAGAIETSTPPAETTLPETVSTAPPPTTVTTTIPEPETTVAPIESFGTPLDIVDLRLAANAIGVLTFGSDAIPALGRLVASLGPPDDDTGDVVSTGELGTCAGDQIRVARWGPLQVITANGVLAAFRLDSTLGGLDTRAATISTLSGLRAGDAVSDLEAIYGGDFSIDLLEDDGEGTIFELRRSTGADLLLWGPISSVEPDGTVLGIYSPDACAA